MKDATTVRISKPETTGNNSVSTPQSPPPPSLQDTKEREYMIGYETGFAEGMKTSRHQYAEELKGKIQLMIDYALGGNSVRSLSKCAQERVLTLQEVLSLLERKGEK